MLPAVSRGHTHVPGGLAQARSRLAQALARARALLDLGRTQAARAAAGRALAQAPEDPEALQLFGLCQLRAGEVGPACETLRAAIVHRPADAHGHYLLGYAGREAGDLRAAEVCFREALRLSPEEPVYLRALAELLAGRKLFPEALGLARRAVELAPDRPANHVTLGYVSSAAGDRAAARRAYEQALLLDPNDAVAWNNLGCVDLAQGQPMQARHRFREALRLNPEGTAAHDNLRLLDPPCARPAAIYRDPAAFERQLIVELCEQVYFHPHRGADQARRPGLRHRVELHLVALCLATAGRALPVLVRRAPRAAGALAVLGPASLWALRVLRAGPLGAAVLVGSGAVTYLLSRQALAEQRGFYAGRLRATGAEYRRLQERWLAGHLGRPERDAAIDRLLEEFCRQVEQA